MKTKTNNEVTKKSIPVWVIMLGLILVLAYLYVGGDYGLLAHYRISQKKEAIISRLDALKAEQDSLRTVLVRAKSDSAFMAKIAREKFNMGLPDEEIIRVVYKEN